VPTDRNTDLQLTAVDTTQPVWTFICCGKETLPRRPKIKKLDFDKGHAEEGWGKPMRPGKVSFR